MTLHTLHAQLLHHHHNDLSVIPCEFRRQIKVMSVIVGHQVLVGILLLSRGHVVKVDGGVDVDEVAGVDGDKGVCWNVPPGKEAVALGQVLKG